MGSRRPGRAGNMNGRVQGEVTRFAVISRVPTPTRLQEHPVPHMCVRKERKDPRIRPSRAHRSFVYVGYNQKAYKVSPRR